MSYGKPDPKPVLFRVEPLRIKQAKRKSGADWVEMIGDVEEILTKHGVEYTRDGLITTFGEQITWATASSIASMIDSVIDGAEADADIEDNWKKETMPKAVEVEEVELTRGGAPIPELAELDERSFGPEDFGGSDAAPRELPPAQYGGDESKGDPRLDGPSEASLGRIADIKDRLRRNRTDDAYACSTLIQIVDGDPSLAFMRGSFEALLKEVDGL